MKKQTGKVDYDQILNHIGQFGPWQKRIHFLLWLVSAAGGLAVVVFSFTAYNLGYRCRIPYCDGFNQEVFSNETKIDTPGLCQYYSVDNLPEMANEETCNEYIESLDDPKVSKIVSNCTFEDLIFDHSIVTSSIVQDYDFTCDRNYLRQLYGVLYMVGMGIGSYIMGAISDKFGRMKALMLGVLLVSGSGILGAFMPDQHSYGILRFLTGIGGNAFFMVTFVICVEYVGPKYTMLSGLIIEIPFALGELVLGLEAYFIRDWVTLQLVAHIPVLLLFGLWFLIPESPRWLLATGRLDEAEKIVRKGAKINNKELPEDIFKTDTLENESLLPSIPEENPSFLDLFKPKLMFFRSLNMMYQWFSVTMCYYGLTFASVDLLEDPYLNFALSCFIEIPGYLFCIFVMACWGRKPILSFLQVVSGLSCIAAGLLYGIKSLEILQIILSLIGKFGASACFAIVYVYTAELFPTVIRNTAIGVCSTIARVGGMFAILIGLLSTFWQPAPMLIMGIMAVVAGTLALLLPETVGSKLPESMEEAMNIGKNNERGMCTCICPKSVDDIFKEN